MVITTATKMIVFGLAMFPVSFAALAVGVLFAAFNLAVSRNPEEKDYLFSNTMMAFALIESFVFMAILVAIIVRVIF